MRRLLCPEPIGLGLGHKNKKLKWALKRARLFNVQKIVSSLVSSPEKVRAL